MGLLQQHACWKDGAQVARIRPLVSAVGAADAHGPFFPTAHPELAEHFYADIMQPARDTRPTPGHDAEACRTMAKCLQRLEAWWTGGLVPRAVLPVSDTSPTLSRYSTWVLVDGGHTRSGRPAGESWFYRQGFERFVLCERIESGRYRYTLARRSDLVAGFPLPSFYDSLNAAEAAARGTVLSPSDRWGGGSSIGGSPRSGGSVLSPEQVARVVEATIAEAATRRNTMPSTRDTS